MVYKELAQYMDRPYKEACLSITNKYPLIDFKPDGAFMDNVCMRADITKEQADMYGIEFK